MSLTNTRRDRHRLATAIALLALAGCAQDPYAVRDPGVEKSALQCAHDEALSCAAKMGKIASCSCSNRDDLREILEPDTRHR